MHSLTHLKRLSLHIISSQGAVSEDYDWYHDSTHEEDELQDDIPNLIYRDAFADRKERPHQIPTPTKHELRDMGHRAEDLIVGCTFNNRRCDHT